MIVLITAPLAIFGVTIIVMMIELANDILNYIAGTITKFTDFLERKVKEVKESKKGATP